MYKQTFSVTKNQNVFRQIKQYKLCNSKPNDLRDVKQMNKNAEQNTEVILAAAATLFRQKGIAATTIRAIAREADMLPGSVTYRFSTKDDLLVALMRRAVERVREGVEQMIAETDDPVDRLRFAMRVHLRVLLDEDDAFHVLMLDWHRLSDKTREALARERARYEQIWDSVIQGAAASGRLVPGLDLTLLRRFAFGVGNSVAFWYQPDDPRSIDEIADAYCALLGLGALTREARHPDPTYTYARMGALYPWECERKLAQTPTATPKKEGDDE